MSFDFFPNEQGAALLNASRNPSTAPEAGTWEGFGSGAATFGMRSMAEAGRAVSLLGSVMPMAADALVGQDNYSGRTLTDRYFETHDDVFQSAVDYWTPRPGEVGVAGQVAGQLAGGALQAIVSPALLVGTATASPGLELVREGVAATTAGKAAAAQGAGMAVGVALPFLGNTLASRLASGAGGNLVQGLATDAATKGVLAAEGYDKQAERYDPFNAQARTLDVMLGAAFGALAHVRTPRAPGAPEPAKLTPTEESALLVANQVHHMEAAAPGRAVTDADATLHADAMRQALEQTLRGELVTVDNLTRDMRMVNDPAQTTERAAVGAEAQRLSELEAPAVDPITLPDRPTPRAVESLAGASPESVKARQFAQDQPELRIPTNLTDAEGRPVTLGAHEALSLADAELSFVRQRGADVFQAVAQCLLGAL